MRFYSANLLTVKQSGFPPEFQRVEYIESTGTQFVDTGVKAGSELSTELKCKISEPVPSSYKCILGASSSQKEYTIWLYTLKWAYEYGADKTRPTNAVPDTSVHTIRTERNKLYLDGALNLTKAESTFEDGLPLTLFARNQGASKSDRISARIYYCKLWDGTALVRDFVPCFRKSDGEIGMYDMVEKEFFGNAGTGSFLKGENVNN